MLVTVLTKEMTLIIQDSFLSTNNEIVSEMILDIEMHTKMCERSFLYNYDETTQNWES